MTIKFSDIDRGNGVLIVDALNLAFRWKHQRVTKFADAYASTVSSLANSYSCNKIIIAADWGSSSYRKGIDENYKGNRAEKYKDQTEEEKEYIKNFFIEYENTLSVLSDIGHTVLRFEKVEADDIAAFLVVNRKRFFPNRGIWLISSDKDWDLLVQNGVSRFSYVTRKETTVENWSEHYDCSPEEYISLKCLMGDSGDNVPGIEGIGPKRALDLINRYGSAFDIYDALPLPGNAKYIQNLNNSGERLLINYHLMDLISFCEDAIGSDNISDIKETFSA